MQTGLLHPARERVKLLRKTRRQLVLDAVNEKAKAYTGAAETALEIGLLPQNATTQRFAGSLRLDL